MKIPFKIIDTELREVIEAREGYFYLNETNLKFFVDYKCNEIKEEDEEDIQKRKEVLYHNVCYFSKEFIDCIDIFFAGKAKRYCIGVYTISSAANVYFERWDEAKRVFDKIINWKYNIK